MSHEANKHMYESNFDQSDYSTLPEQAQWPKLLLIDVYPCETTASNFKAISITQVELLIGIGIFGMYGGMH